jgi:hypothetical protein
MSWREAIPCQLTDALYQRDGLILRNQYRKLRKHLEVIGIERVNSLNPIRLHGRDDLQIEDACSDDWSAL